MATKFTALSPNVRLKYRAQGATLHQFHTQSDVFIRILIGPLGSAKTNACIFDVIHCMDNQTPDANGVRRSRWVAARNTYPDLQTTTIKDWNAITVPLGVGVFKNGSPPSWSCWYRKPDGTNVDAEIIFLALDIASDEKKARGQQLSGVWINETKEMNKTNVDMLIARVKRFPPKAEVPDAKFHVIGDSNAPDRDHWLAKLALEVHPKGWWFGIQPGGVIKQGGKWVDNPAAENRKNLAADYYMALIPGKKESWVRKNLANEFVFHADGQPVHPGFNEQAHTGPCEAIPNIELCVGVDFGRTPAACIMQQQLNGVWYVFHELVSSNTNAKDFGEALSAFINRHYAGFQVSVTGDPAGDDMAQTRDETPIDMLNLSGLGCLPAPTNDFEERTTSLDSLLSKMIDGQPAIRIHPRCRTLVRGLAGAYQFKRIMVAGDDRFHNKPDKGPESHVCEALHYALLGAGVGSALFEDAWGSNDDDMEPIDKSYFE